MSTERTTHPQNPVGPQTAAAEPACACWSRRESLMAAGVAVAGTAGLTACGSGTGDAIASAASGAASAVGQAISTADIPVGGGKIFDDIKVVVTQPTEGEYKAFSAICTHRQCTVSSVAGGVITCQCHLSEFDAATGAVRKGPATQPLPPKTVSVGADGITVT